ncbi:MAG: hypothetical protein V3V78_00420 [Candidatus Woesearchaeota archaeon]
MNKILKTITFAFMIIGSYAIIDATSDTWRGYHNIDLGQNMEYINEKYDMNLIDTARVTSYNIFDKEEKKINMTGRDLIIAGTDQMKRSFAELVVGFFLIIMSLCIFLIEKDNG